MRLADGFQASAPSADEVRALARKGLPWLSKPFHLMTASANLRTRCAGAVCHVPPKRHACGCFVYVCEGICASSPEACFVQLATVVTLVRLIEVGCELCGTYRRAGNERGYVRAKPLTCVAKLRKHLDGSQGVTGAKRARQALDFVVDGSASPMETVVVAFACLPPRLGGYGIPFPVMNGLVEVPASMRKSVSKSRYYCDLYWPDVRLALEYESDERHTGSGRIFRDSSRRADLAHLGVEVVTLTKLQLFDRREFEKVIALLKKRLGCSRRSSQRYWTPEHVALRRELLDFSRRDV